MLSPEAAPLKVEEYEKIPGDILDKLKMSLSSLAQSLLAVDPEMPNHLRNSHAILVEYPETAHLLDDDEIKSLIQAAETHTNTKIVSETAKSKKTISKQKIAGMNADDL